jgi:hypothetical protein
MNEPTIPKNFSLENFARIYTSHAFEIASHEISLNDFDNQVRERTSKELGISKELVLNLHHPFHWVFLMEGESPFEYTSSNKDILKIKAKRNYSSGEIENYSNQVLKKYGTHLQAKINLMN